MNAMELRLRGMTYAEIGKALGVSRQRAQQLVRPPRPIYEAVKARAGGKCELCGLEISNGHVHHKERVNDYNGLDNLQYLCVVCHKGEHPSELQFEPVVEGKVRKVTFRVDDDLVDKLKEELEAWRAVRGPKFSLNELCVEKLSRKMTPTLWPSVKEVMPSGPDHSPISVPAGGHAEPAAEATSVSSPTTGMPPPPRFEESEPSQVETLATVEPEAVAVADDDLLCERPEAADDAS